MGIDMIILRPLPLTFTLAAHVQRSPRLASNNGTRTWATELILVTLTVVTPPSPKDGEDGAPSGAVVCLTLSGPPVPKSKAKSQSQRPRTGVSAPHKPSRFDFPASIR